LAIPIDDDCRKALETLKRGALPEYGLLGLAPRAARLVDPALKTGAAVEDVMPGTPAAKVGLRAGDIITHVDDQVVQDDLHLIRLVSALPAESQVTLRVLRDVRAKKTLVLTATLSKKYQESARESFAEVREPAWRGMRVDYATASPVFRELARHVDPEGCVAVIDVERDSPAWKAGLRNGTFVSHVGQQRVSTPRQFREAVEQQTGEAALRITSAGDGDPVRKVAAP
jgi:serine protease Do